MEKVPREDTFAIELVKAGGMASAYRRAELSNKDSFKQIR